MLGDAQLVERTLLFSGSYVSDNGHVRITRDPDGPFEYSGSWFLGFCDVCERAALTSPDGESLHDLRAAVVFSATHTHDDVD